MPPAQLTFNYHRNSSLIAAAAATAAAAAKSSMQQLIKSVSLSTATAVVAHTSGFQY
jgi:hypothetical protein